MAETGIVRSHICFIKGVQVINIRGSGGLVVLGSVGLHVGLGEGAFDFVVGGVDTVLVLAFDEEV